jgi:hypothetical protein
VHGLPRRHPQRLAMYNWRIVVKPSVTPIGEGLPVMNQLSHGGAFPCRRELMKTMARIPACAISQLWVQR